jgi:hypothetical protein
MNQMIRFLKPPVFEDHEKTITARLLHSLLVVILLMLVFFVPWFVVADPDSRFRLSLVAGTIMITCIFLLWLEHRGHIRFASQVLIIIIWLAMTFLVFTGTGVRGPAIWLDTNAGGDVWVLLGGQAAVASANRMAGVLWLVADGIILAARPALSPLLTWLCSFSSG